MAFISWWYGEGWKRQSRVVAERVAGLFDTFSIELVLKTLFSPFRQISAGRVDGPIGIQIQAFVDKTISRFIGALVRIAVLIAGIISIIVSAVVGVLIIVGWPLMPVLPFIGFVLAISGWVPFQS